MGQQQTVLIADDDLRLLRLIQRNLELADYRVVTAADGLSLLRLAESESADLYVVDVMMPGLNGREVTRCLREFSMAPVLMLTASDTEADTVAGLQAGADDYLTKPFGAPAFLARVRALLRRVSRSNAHAAQSTLTTGELTIELSHHRVLRAGMPINLTPTEYRLLEYLARHAGRVVSQQELLGSVWGPAYVDEHHLLRVNIARLRRKVEVDTATPEYIITRAGVGYSLARHEARQAG